MVIPAGKKLIIMIKEGTSAGQDIFDWAKKTRVPLLLANDVSLNLSSTFSQFLGDSGISKGLSALFGSIKIIRDNIGTGSFQQMGLQTWEKTDPVSLSIEIDLQMLTDAKIDVYEPAKLLMKLPLPTLTKSGTGSLIPPGPTVWSAVQDTISDVSKSFTGKRTEIDSKGEIFSRGNIFSIQIGKTLWLDEVVFKKVTPVFSMEVDENNYPINCKLSVEIDSILTATTNMIDDFDSQSIFINRNDRG